MSGPSRFTPHLLCLRNARAFSLLPFFPAVVASVAVIWGGISSSSSSATLDRVESTILSSLYALPFYDFDLRASHARTLLPAALASVPFGFVLVRVRVRVRVRPLLDFKSRTLKIATIAMEFMEIFQHVSVYASLRRAPPPAQGRPNVTGKSMGPGALPLEVVLWS